MSPATSIDPEELAADRLGNIPRQARSSAQIAPAVQRELETILESPCFRTSNRCQAFLRHIVQNASVPSELKERTIGVAVFGRASDYDTGNDAIVRVKAIEVRKRLMQYNRDADPERKVIIELHSGSYQPRIVYRKPSKPEPEIEEVALPSPAEETRVAAPMESRSRIRIRWWMIATVSALVLLMTGLGIHQVTSGSASKRFLHPFIAKQPIISISNHNAYNLSLQNLKKKGDAPEAVRLREMLEHAGRSTRLSVADDITKQDLVDSPMIVLGGPRHNRWTAELTKDLRFNFQVVDDKPSIVDRNNPDRHWQNVDPTNQNPLDDYALVTRLLATPTRQQVLSIAGLKALGTVGGAQIVFNPSDLETILRNAPEDWEQKNLQFVLHIQRQGQSVSGWDIRAATAW